MRFIRINKYANIKQPTSNSAIKINIHFYWKEVHKNVFVFKIISPFIGISKSTETSNNFFISVISESESDSYV